MPTKKIFKFISNAFSGILFLLLILMIFIVISSKTSGGEPQFLGYQLKTVLSGSMEPTFKTGSIIAIAPGGDMTRFKEGDVITYTRDSMSKDLVTHRVLEVIKKDGEVHYMTKGDNNEDPDKSHVWSNAVVGEYTGFNIPYIGYFVNFASSREGSILLMGVPALLLLFYSFSTFKSAFRESRDKKNDSETPTNV